MTRGERHPKLARGHARVNGLDLWSDPSSADRQSRLLTARALIAPGTPRHTGAYGTPPTVIRNRSPLPLSCPNEPRDRFGSRVVPTGSA